MKKIFLSLLVTATFCLSLSAQDEKYTMAIEARIADVDTLRKPEQLVALSAYFERIADTEKTKWLPYYYAALTQTNAALFMGMDNLKAETVDPMADKAEALINKAEELSKNNSEIFVVKKMIASLRMMVDPMNRYMKYGQIAEEALTNALKYNPENPRVYLLQAQDKYFTPEQFGGSKEEAKRLFELAQKKYTVFKPSTSIDPVWGKNITNYFLSELNK